MLELLAFLEAANTATAIGNSLAKTLVYLSYNYDSASDSRDAIDIVYRGNIIGDANLETMARGNGVDDRKESGEITIYFEGNKVT